MPRLSVALKEGEGIRVFGPAQVEVESGLVTILGAELGPGFRAEVGETRSYLVKALKQSTIHVSIAPRGRVEMPQDGEEPLEEWIHTADKIVEDCSSECTVVVVGPVESGKTSLTAVLANRSLARGIPTGVIDADVGQADIGPPGFVSLSLPGSWVIWLRQLDPVAARFIGSIEPGPAAGRIISSVSILRARAKSEGAALVAVDTDGWVQGWNALEHKVDLARAVEADAVVVVGDHNLYSFLDKALESNVYYARSPRVLAQRSVEDRKRLRSENYMRFLEGVERSISLRSVKVQGSCLTGSPFDDPRLKSIVESTLGEPVRLMTRYPGGVCVILDTSRQFDPHDVKGSLRKALGGEVLVVSKGSMRGVLAALVAPDGNEHPAVLADINLDSMEAIFKTRYDGPIVKVVFGRIKLGDGYYEEVRGRILV